MVWLHLAIVLICILIGVRIGGIGLGLMGSVGVAILVFVFQLNVVAPPIDVMLIILTVITAASAMQAAGGLDYLVSVAEKILRKHPSRITFLAPMITYLFTLGAGTGHVAYAVMPVISEVALKAGVRPERPMSIAAIASQQAITASPVSAATAAMIGSLATAGYANISLTTILAICLPATFIGCMTAAFVMNFVGKDLKDCPIYQAKLAAGEIKEPEKGQTYVEVPGAKRSVVIFLCGSIGVVILGIIRGSSTSLKAFLFDRADAAGNISSIGMAQTIEIVMFVVAALIVILCKVDVKKLTKVSVFDAGVMAVIAIFGVGWMGDIFFNGNRELIIASLGGVVQAYPWVFAFALFILSILLYSQASTTRILMPVGLALGINPYYAVAMFPSVNGYFFIPSYPTMVAAINFDQTGTTRIGKFLFNHSFMIPGIVATAVAVTVGFGIARIIM